MTKRILLLLLYILGFIPFAIILVISFFIQFFWMIVKWVVSGEEMFSEDPWVEILIDKIDSLTNKL